MLPLFGPFMASLCSCFEQLELSVCQPHAFVENSVRKSKPAKQASRSLGLGDADLRSIRGRTNYYELFLTALSSLIFLAIVRSLASFQGLI